MARRTGATRTIAGWPGRGTAPAAHRRPGTAFHHPGTARHHLHGPPGSYSPPGYGPPGYPPRRGSSGLAIASLVLSILWLGGIGSLLAVIFGFSARRSVRRSQGQLSGGGIALAGLIIGILGLIGTALIAVGIAVAVNKYSTETNPLGTTVQFTNNVDGLQSMTVYSIKYPVGAGSDPGTELAVVDMKVCGGPSGSQNGPGDFGLSLQFSGQNVYVAISPARTRPMLNPSNGIAQRRRKAGT